MKRTILTWSVAFLYGFGILMMASCSGEGSSNHDHSHDGHEHNDGHDHGDGGEMAVATYACPMDCENGKTYAEMGTCPTCGMDLEKVEGDANSEAAPEEETAEPMPEEEAPEDAPMEEAPAEGDGESEEAAPAEEG